jgi:transcription elongation factor Elf1
MKLKKENLDKAKKPQLNIGAVICSACGAENSMRWGKKSIGIDDKQGSYLDLTFDFCEECGHVENVDFS